MGARKRGPVEVVAPCGYGAFPDPTGAPIRTERLSIARGESAAFSGQVRLNPAGEWEILALGNRPWLLPKSKYLAKRLALLIPSGEGWVYFQARWIPLSSESLDGVHRWRVARAKGSKGGHAPK